MLRGVGALHAFDQHLHGAVGQLEHLQDARDAADLEHVVGLGLVLAGGLLRHQHDLAARFHGRLERLDRLRPAHEQRDHHVREHDHVAQRQQRQRDRVGRQNGMSGHCETSLSQAHLGPETQDCKIAGAPRRLCRRGARRSGAGLGLLAVDQQRLGAVFDRCARRPRPWPRRRASAGRTWCRSATAPGSSAGRARRSCAPAPCARWPPAPTAGSRVRRRPSRTASGTA